MADGTQQRLEKIWSWVREIPAGRVASYGQIAQIAGIPRGARQVGYALRQLPAGSNVPWHRVVNAAGRISLPPGSKSYREQLQRLRDEGVPVIAGKIRLGDYGWEPDLDELLWKPEGL